MPEIGIRGQTGPRSLWARRTVVFLLTALGMLLVPLSAVLVSKAGKAVVSKGETGNATSQVTTLVRDVLKEASINHGEIEISGLKVDPDELSFLCRVESPQPLSSGVANQIRDKVKTKFKQEKISVKLVTELLIESSEEPANHQKK